MAQANGFQKNSIDWQLQQVQRQVEEWLELVLGRSGGNSSPGWSFPPWFLQGCFWLIAVSLTAWAGWQLYKLLRPYLPNSLRSEPLDAAPRSPQSTAAEWRQRARLAQQQGDYREACRSLYLAMLQQLSDRHLLQAEPSRTDGEYLNLAQTVSCPQAYRLLIDTHERLYFGNVVVSADLFDRCWQAYQEIERL